MAGISLALSLPANARFLLGGSDDAGLEGKLSDKSVLITCASAGLGLETSEALFKTGATLYLTARDLNKTRSALEEIADTPRVHLLKLELTSLASLRTCATEFLSKTDKLNILIANAGVIATPEGRTQDGFETQFGVNYLARFLLFVFLRSALLNAAKTTTTNSRAIFLSSIAHQYLQVNLDNIYKDGRYENGQAVPQFKSAEQGAATSVWGAGVQIVKKWNEKEGQWVPGYFPHAYSPEEERRLWEVSVGLVGISE
ncbi:hypothetical protein BDW74DRAFT_170895 [Aspergillus multicolor]|uniref:uncharacterized protein n=1 Tax=Aspergillus multicolor TaxID=41759 RepID=UPI003CCDA37B